MKTSFLFCAGAAALLSAAAAAAAGRIAIVSEHKAGETWQPAAARPAVGYPAAAANKSQDVCVNIGFLIDKEGKTSNFAELKSWSSASSAEVPPAELVQAFVQSAAAQVASWQFQPVGKPRQIYTSASFAFEGATAGGADAIRARCRISDLSAFVSEAKNKDQLAAERARKDARSSSSMPIRNVQSSSGY